MISTVKKVLDTVRPYRGSTIYAVRGDYNSRFINAVIQVDGTPQKAMPGESVTVTFERDDTESKTFGGSVNTDGSVTVPISSFAVEMEGDVWAWISIAGTERKLSTTKFLIEVQDIGNIGGAVTEDDPEYDDILVILSRLDGHDAALTDMQISISKTEERLQGRISANTKRIENLESGIPAESFITDDSVAYVKDVPDNVAPNAVLTKIGGMTYKDGNALKSAKVTEVKSVGANLWSLGDIVSTGYTYDVANAFKHLSPNNQYTCAWKYSSNGTKDTQNQIIVYTDAGGINIGNSIPFTITEAQMSTIQGAYAYFGSDVTSGSMTNIMLNKGTTALPYTSYQEHTLPIPEAVQALDGYGWGINESVYNYIDWEKKQFVKRVGCVDMGTLTWYYTNPFGTGVMCFRTPSIADAKLVGATDVPNLLCDLYPSITANKMSSGSEGITSLDALNGIFVCDSNYTDAATFKSAMSGVILYYELAEPVITDISDLLPADNLISVEGGGTITFENEYKYAVPSTVIYQLR